jgi:hypothetical protein
MAEDDVPKKVFDSDVAMIAHIVQRIRENEGEVERLAAESGKLQDKTIGVHMDSGSDLLRVRITCEPRQFAKLEITGMFAPVI